MCLTEAELRLGDGDHAEAKVRAGILKGLKSEKRGLGDSSVGKVLKQ